MQDFVCYTPTKVAFGKNAMDKLPTLIRETGAKKVLLHYGSDRVIRSGLMDRVRAAVKEAGAVSVELGGVVPNPRLSLVYRGAELCKTEKVDLVLGVGGGSVLDSAKAIAYAACYDGDVWDLYLRKAKAKTALPVGTVMTIAATGSEMSDSSVITNDDPEKPWEKHGYSSEMGRARFAVMDPTLTMTLPAYQTFSGITDIMMHTLERYFTNKPGLELTDGIAEALLRDVMKNAKILLEKPDDYEARAEIFWAGALSHNGLTGLGSDGGDWTCHQLEHELGAMFDVAHGAGLAAVWGSWARYVMDDCLERFYLFATRVMGVPAGEDLRSVAAEGITRLEAFFRSIGMPTGLRALGIEPTEQQILHMAHALSVFCGGQRGAAKILREADFAQIYRNAL